MNRRHGKITGGYEPYKYTIYKLFDDYFEHPVLIKTKDIHSYSVYMVKMPSMLAREFRYIIVFVVRNSYPLGHKEKLSQLLWISFQTRTLEEYHDLPIHNYTPKRYPPLMKTISLVSRNESEYQYNSEEYNLSIALLAKRKGEMEYSNKGTIVNALETYNTVITFLS